MCFCVSSLWLTAFEFNEKMGMCEIETKQEAQNFKHLGQMR